jgi:hypothetical protein
MPKATAFIADIGAPAHPKNPHKLRIGPLLGAATLLGISAAGWIDVIWWVLSR